MTINRSLASIAVGLLLAPLAMAQTAPAEEEAAKIQRLHGLLAAYHSEMRELEKNAPAVDSATATGNTVRAPAVTFEVDKVHLNGSEGSAALNQISLRLTDADLEETAQEVAPVFSIETHLYGTLVGNDSRSLKPVGKNHFIARTRLLPGQTTVKILDRHWELQRPKDAPAKDFLITFYSPPGGTPELHLFAIDDLLAEQNPHIPDWLPDALKIKSRAG